MNALQRLLAAALGIVLFIAAFLFASVIFAVGAALALLVWAWLMWRTRGLRREAREGRKREGAGGTVIEGEYRVERETPRIDDDVR